MDYLLAFHWWYIPLGLFLLLLIFGKGKGGMVVKRLTAGLKILDQRFEECHIDEADYTTFKEGPDHLEIEIENLKIPTGEALEFQINGVTFAKVKVKGNKKAEYDQWSDEDSNFPRVKKGDELIVKYNNTEVLKGKF